MPSVIENIDWSLYAIIDHDIIKNRSLRQITEALISGGVSIIQVRNKSANIRTFYEEASRVLDVARQFNIPVIINDRLDIAMATDADGVHVGQEDLPVWLIKKMWRKEKIIGASVHSVNEFNQTKTDEPTYYGVGTIYATNTKQRLTVTGTTIISELRKRTTRPLIGIGGITPENLGPVFKAGADGVAVISALLKADDLKTAATDLRKKIDSCKHK